MHELVAVNIKIARACGVTGVGTGDAIAAAIENIIAHNISSARESVVEINPTGFYIAEFVRKEVGEVGVDLLIIFVGFFKLEIGPIAKIIVKAAVLHHVII